MKSVVLIDDDRTVRSVLARYLQHNGWQVWEADDGETGLELVRKQAPVAVICDLLMPRLNGFHVCTAIRDDQVLRHTRIIAMSGTAYRTNRQSALEAGADEFLTKPFSPREVLSLLYQLLPDLASTTPGNGGETAPASTPAVLRFWGVRGSIPAPGPTTVFYGGNTSCIEVRADGEIIILDAGTGIRPLGRALISEFQNEPLNLTLLITHTHWDHIQGFPFFVPAYDPRNRIRILGFDGARESLARVFSGQMESHYFPISLKELPSHVQIEELKDMDFFIGKVRVQAAFMNHPGVCVGYRLFTSQGSIAYLPDNEPFQRLREQSDAKILLQEGALEFMRAEEEKLITFVRGADMLITDAQYDLDEYRSHCGWGHSCVDDSVKLALRAGAKRLFLFHHDPAHEDEKISLMVEHARRLVAAQKSSLVVEAAREGANHELAAAPASDTFTAAGS